MDWRRIVAVDIEAVVSQIDVDALQEHIAAVTFCSLDSERCPRCHSPLDPALVKLLRLAQLSVEWLLHCQEFLTLSLHAQEERLEARAKEREQLLARHKELEEKMKKVNGELKQRKKLIRDQQLMIAPGISHKCQHCEKSFLTELYLQKHLQRRHPDEYDRLLRTDSENKSEIDRFKAEVTSLKEQIVQLQQALQTKAVQEKEQESLHRELERFKAEHIAHVDRRLEDNRDGMRREMEFMCHRNIQALNVTNQPPPVRQESSPIQMEPEKDQNTIKEMYHKLEQQLKKKDKKWESQLQEINTRHESEKNQLRNELNQLQRLMSEQQEQSHRQSHELSRKLLEKEQTIKSQREQIKTMAANKPAKVVETQVLHTAAAPEPKPKRLVIESSSVSEAKPVVQNKPERSPEKKRSSRSVKHEPSLRKTVRPELEEKLLRKLEVHGVKPSCSGLKDKELNSILKKLHLERDSAAQRTPEFLSCREAVKKALQSKMSGGSNKAAQVVQFRTRSSSLPARATTVRSTSEERRPKTPQPAPRSKPQPQTSTPKDPTPWRSRSISDEESEEDSEDESDSEDELHQRNSSGVVQSGARRPGPVLTKQASVSSQSQARGGPVRSTVTRPVTTPATTAPDSDEDDWSDVSELQEIPKGLHRFTDQNGNLDQKGSGKETKISDMAKKLEQQFTERLAKRPAGGISVLPERKDEVLELSCTDLEESSEWASSSLERQNKPKAAPLKKSLDSSTSVWGTSTGKGPRSSLTEASAGNTLKSSLYSISDVTDDDFSN